MNRRLMLTTDQINEIEAMCEKASAGPWEYSREKRLIESSTRYIAKWVVHFADGDLIAAARTLLPQLAADYRKAMEVVEAAKEYLDADGSITAQRLYDALAGLEG